MLEDTNINRISKDLFKNKYCFKNSNSFCSNFNLLSKSRIHQYSNSDLTININKLNDNVTINKDNFVDIKSSSINYENKSSLYKDINKSEKDFQFFEQKDKINNNKDKFLFNHYNFEDNNFDILEKNSFSNINKKNKNSIHINIESIFDLEIKNEYYQKFFH